MCEQPVQRDGAVIRETVISQLESKDFNFQRMHFEFAIELCGAADSSLSKFSPSFATSSDCFFRHSRGCKLYSLERKNFFR